MHLGGTLKLFVVPVRQAKKLFPVYKAKYATRTLNITVTSSGRTTVGFSSTVVTPNWVWMTLLGWLTDCCDPCGLQRTRPNLLVVHHLMSQIISNYTPAIMRDMCWMSIIKDHCHFGVTSWFTLWPAQDLAAVNFASRRKYIQTLFNTVICLFVGSLKEKQSAFINRGSENWKKKKIKSLVIQIREAGKQCSISKEFRHINSLHGITFMESSSDNWEGLAWTVRQSGDLD